MLTIENKPSEEASITNASAAQKTTHKPKASAGKGKTKESKKRKSRWDLSGVSPEDMPVYRWQVNRPTYEIDGVRYVGIDPRIQKQQEILQQPEPETPIDTSFTIAEPDPIEKVKSLIDTIKLKLMCLESKGRASGFTPDEIELVKTLIEVAGFSTPKPATISKKWNAKTVKQSTAISDVASTATLQPQPVRIKSDKERLADEIAKTKESERAHAELLKKFGITEKELESIRKENLARKSQSLPSLVPEEVKLSTRRKNNSQETKKATAPPKAITQKASPAIKIPAKAEAKSAKGENIDNPALQQEFVEAFAEIKEKIAAKTAGKKAVTVKKIIAKAQPEVSIELKAEAPQVRYLKIHSLYRNQENPDPDGRRYKIVPELCLSGNWLHKLGFSPEKYASITTFPGLMVIRLTE